MVRVQLSDQQWSKIEAFLRSERRAGRPAYDDRRFFEAVLWWRRTGVPWRHLPSDFGPWKTVFNRFDRWAKTGKWERLFLALQTDRDDEWHSLDSTINRAHQHASGGSETSVGRGAVQSSLRDRMHVQPAQTGSSLGHPIRENSAQLRGCRRSRMRVSWAEDLSLVLQTLSQLDEHGHDAHQHLLAHLVASFVEQRQA